MGILIFAFKANNKLEISVEQYENIVNWKKNYSGLDSLVQVAAKDGKITQNEMYHIQNKYAELRMSKAKKEIMK
ncbi:MAG: hypothetical protein ACOC80_16755 [Petrotogales bacterium]